MSDFLHQLLRGPSAIYVEEMSDDRYAQVVWWILSYESDFAVTDSEVGKYMLCRLNVFSIVLLSIYNIVNKYSIKNRVQLCKLKYAFLKFCCNTECSRKNMSF